MNDKEIEKVVMEKNLNAPRVTIEDINSVIMDVTFTMLPSGKVMVCEITLLNGFTVRGESATVSKENFDQDLGRDISYSKARDKIWELEGYLLQQKLYMDRRSRNQEVANALAKRRDEVLTRLGKIDSDVLKKLGHDQANSN